MVEPLRHRQTKGAETDMFDLQLPRHISTLPLTTGTHLVGLLSLSGSTGHASLKTLTASGAIAE